MISSPASSTASTRTASADAVAAVYVLLWLAGLAVATIAVLTLTPRNAKGVLTMPWWVLEVATTAVLVAIALWLGPFIKRFGRAYAADVFHDNPLTGKSYIVLTDVVYYLIFTAYIFFTVHFEPPDDWRSFIGNVTAEPAAVGGGAGRRDPAHHRDPPRPQHRADAGARAAVLPEPAPAPGVRPPTAAVRRQPEERSIYRRAAELERAADDDNLA